MLNRIDPGEWLGLMGGGQLGRMFTHAAQALGFRVCVLDPTADSPAGQAADEQIVAAYDDPAALDRLATRCRAVTTEFENVPASALSRLAQRVRVAPAPEAVAVAQDRALEKRFIASQHVPVAPHAVITRIDDFRSIDPKLFPGILKTARLGYDGKGQEKVASADAAREAWSRMNGVTCVLEKALPLRKEVSCIVARGADGDSATFPLSENEHRNGILAVSIAPARITPELERQARQHATRIADALAYVGVLCVEFFVLDEGDNGRLLVNEIAPRPHNSGHYTIDACVTSQFEQQARILAGLPLGSTAQMAASVMLNVLGDVWFDHGKLRTPDWAGVLRVPGAKLHLYGKAEPRLGRKMGHVTAVNGTIEAALGRANEVARVLGIAPAD
ncbi:MAG TPA: 5-(carboxyamino)imidazole ribonucleotide synthase [Burkholderiaceae bacterium]|nr:5-(carboxyamino)imidazole ribonucleotide synthase [Burkholderiaceae bacterium]